MTQFSADFRASPWEWPRRVQQAGDRGQMSSGVNPRGYVLTVHERRSESRSNISSNLSARDVTKQLRARRNDSETGNKTMDMTRFFGLDSFEWSVTLASSALIAFAVWVM
jgi:hypothetical protein